MVVFQEQSIRAGQLWSFIPSVPRDPDYLDYNFDINSLVTYVKSKIDNNNLRIGLNATWSHSSGYSSEHYSKWYDAKPHLQHDAVQKTIPAVANYMSQCDFIVNTGMAIKLARNNPILAVLGNNLLLPDGSHLAPGIPMYIASMTYANAICGINPEDVAWYPTSADDSSIDTPVSSFLSYEARRCACAASIEQIEKVTDKWNNFGLIKSNTSLSDYNACGVYYATSSVLVDNGITDSPTNSPFTMMVLDRGNYIIQIIWDYEKMYWRVYSSSHNGAWRKVDGTII